MQGTHVKATHDKARERLEATLVVVDDANCTAAACSWRGVVEPDRGVGVIGSNRDGLDSNHSAVRGVVEAGVEAVGGDVSVVFGLARRGEC